ncbi:MAG: hypothetical protein V7740_03750 [Pseudomonas marincola]
MQIEPYILLPIAALFVGIVIVFIRLVAGPRNAKITEEGCLQLMKFEEPETNVHTICISLDQSAALLLTDAAVPLRLVRRHGDKLVLQIPDISDVKTTAAKNGLIQIRRQDFSHPAINIQCEIQDAINWQTSLEKFSAAADREVM